MQNVTILDTGNFRNPTEAEQIALLQLKFEQETAELQVRRGAIALYVVGAIQLLYAGFLYYSGQALYAVIALLFFGALFVGSGFLTRRYPFASFLSMLVLYLLLMIVGGMAEPGLLYKGIIIKIIILVILIKGILAARRLANIKTQAAALGMTPTELRSVA